MLKRNLPGAKPSPWAPPRGGLLVPPLATLLAALLVATALASTTACTPSDSSTADTANLPGQGDDADQTVLYRDTWGVAHIYSPTVEGGLYAMGWGQAEDRPEQLLQNLLIAIGELSSIAGDAAVPSDLRSHMWDHYGAGKKGVESLRPDMRAHVEAYVAGMNDFYDQHPDDVPAWWGDREIDVPMILAFGRLFLYNWSIDEAYEDLERGGIEAGYDADQRGSNQFVVAPERSASGHAILAIDPHLSWTGPSRFWEFRIHAGDLHGSGVTLPGSPYIGLGHTRNLAWAMTTGGPDTADVYELTIDPADPGKYLYDGESRDFEVREVTLRVRGEDGVAEQSHELTFSHHGPVIAKRGGKAYVGKIAYGDMVSLDAWYELNFAKDYQGAVRAMETLSVFPQNVMVADTSGNIYYQRTGRVPERPDGYDWGQPVDGSTAASEWTGVHPASDHLQVLNPPQGYMQNCNIPPDAMMVDSPFQLDGSARDYLFSGPGYGSARSGWTNQRGARAVELLAADDSVTAEEAMAYINDVHPYGSERWIEALRGAHEAFGDRQSEHEHYGAAIEALLAWDQRITKDSAGGLLYDFWRRRLSEDLGREQAGALADGIDDWMAQVEGREAEAVAVSESDQQAMVDALAAAADDLLAAHGSLDAVYGDRHRAGRDDTSFPIGGGGGGQVGMTTLRTISYAGERDDHTRWARAGQTSTQVIVLSDPPQSWMYIPLGQSDRPDSPHYLDQAEKALSPRQLKPTWWLPEDLAPNIESRTVLEEAPGGEQELRDAA